MINKYPLKLTLSLIQKDEEFGHIFLNKLMGIPIKIDFARHQFNEEAPKIVSFLRFINNNYYDIITITNRLAWQKDLWINKKIDMGTWMNFAKLDVELFFMKVRSIFDYVAMVLCRVSDNKKVPKGDKRTSFNKLRNWLINPNTGSDNAKIWDQELADLVISANWFDEMKNIRDALSHQGGYVLVFPDQKKILAQIYMSHKNQINIPEIMFNENVVDFELFAGLHFGYLTAFLENFAIIVENKLPQNVREINASPFSPFKKIPPIFEWAKKLL